VFPHIWFWPAHRQLRRCPSRRRARLGESRPRCLGRAFPPSARQKAHCLRWSRWASPTKVCGGRGIGPGGRRSSPPHSGGQSRTRVAPADTI